MLKPTCPQMGVTDDFRIPAFDPSAYSYSPFNSPYNSSTPVTNNGDPGDGLLDAQFPSGFSMPYSQPEEVQPQSNVDWTTYDFSALGGNDPNMLVNDPNFFANQTMPLASEQFGNLNLGMTPSSGDVTDVDEFGFSRNDQPRSQSGDASTGVSSPENSQMDRYRLSVDGTPQMQSSVLANENLDNLDIDDFLRQAQEETKRMSIQNQMRQIQHPLQVQLSQNNSQESLVQSQTPPGIINNNASSMHPFTVHEAQERAHSADVTPAPGMMKPVLPASLATDPSWSAAPDMSNPTLTLDDAQEDEDWIR